MITNNFPNQYVGGLTPRQKALRWKPKRWFKVEDLCDPSARLIPLYGKG